MKLILAQGNPGPKYANTRHNVGFKILDAYAARLGASFVNKPKFNAEIAEATVDGEKVLLVKPATFYNETGRSARQLVDFYKLDTASDVLVVHDDIALPFGSLRTRQQGSDAGNNGIKSLNAHLGHNYWRLRVGIYSTRRDQLHDADFVLSDLSKQEQQALRDEVIPLANEQISNFIQNRLGSSSWKIAPKVNE